MNAMCQPAATCHGASPSRPDPDLAPLLAAWRVEGRRLVEEHRTEFAGLLDRVGVETAARRLGSAAAWAQVAANYAVLCHPGEYASARLERAIESIGAEGIPWRGARDRAPWKTEGLRVLHVLTEVKAVGGHARNVERWMAADEANTHSIALTRQHTPLPPSLEVAVAASSGRIHQINRRMGGLLGWGRALQSVIDASDLVVLHVHNNDVVPFLALAGMGRHRPPVVFIDHADHMFWVGARFADLFVNTRLSGHRLAARRRGIPAERLHLMPLCLAPVARGESRDEAKRRIGLPGDAVVLLSVARGVKFRPLGPMQFPDPLVPLLRDSTNVHLLVVGADKHLDWSSAEAAAPGRIHRIAETPETRPYFEAADIYVDSFPFVSITSLLEAGLSGLPLIARSAFGPGAETMGADSLGLDEILRRIDSAEALRAEVESLVADPDRHRTIGDLTRLHIEATNTGPGWQRALRTLYERVAALQGTPGAAPGELAASDIEDVDLFTPFLFGDVASRSTAAERLTIAASLALKSAPATWRATQLARLWRQGHLRHMPMSVWRQALPEWATIRARSLLRSPK